MKIYVGCAIDQSSVAQEQFAQLVSLIKSVFESCVIFNPLPAYNINGFENLSFEDLEYIHDVNMYALNRCNLAVFKVTDIQSFGLPVEICKCNERNIPYLIWYDCNKTSGVYLRYYGTGNDRQSNIVKTSQELTKKLKTFLNNSLANI